MVYTYKELLEIYKDDYNIKRAIENKKIYKIEKGIYSDKRIVNPLLVYSKKYPNATITMDNAFYYYDLTDIIPNKICLATSSKSHTINNVKIIQIYMKDNILNLGKTLVKLNDNNYVYMYDKERLLIELIRKRNKIPFDYYKEIISNYRDIAYELDMTKLEEYLDYFNNGNNLFAIIQREVF